jgi:hypothetical protein
LGSFADHIAQSKQNLRILEKINAEIEDSWDWQVTVCFYSSLHIVNAHIVGKTAMNFLSHQKVDDVINPFNQLSLARLPEDVYKSYIKLYQLSRRSRYLLSENQTNNSGTGIQPGCITYSKHLKKAVYHLEQIINFANQNHGFQIAPINIKCPDFKAEKYSNFVCTN